MFAYITFVLICVELWIVNAQTPTNWGSCPDHPTVDQFDLEKFQGPWYEIERSFYVFELLGNCPKFNFSITSGDSMEVKFSMKNRITGNKNVIDGLAYPKPYNPAIWDYRVNSGLPKYLSRIMPGSGKYFILDTDYDSYAIMYSCSNLGLFHSDLIWVLGRDKNLEPESRTLIYTHLNNLHIDEARLTLSKQLNCP
ncbi:apolipoprotein D-like [Planococcus citri]|uniref:apolipoprotein D-like n=1 Tax=Planococcus citri TaxID=170843 RepID=UPI0031F9B046